MLKKKILFIMPTLEIGGAEKSLITILNLLDYDRYDVDLFLISHKGEFMKMIPNKVNVLPEDKKYKYYKDNDKKIVPFKYLMRLDLMSAFFSIKWLIEAKISRVLNKKLYIGWNNKRHFFNQLKTKYDVAISFLERDTIYFNIDKVWAKKRIGFIHCDYSKYSYDYKLDKRYLKRYNYIATVSEDCKKVLTNIFPEYKEKFLVIKNMIMPEIINNLSKEQIINFKKEKDELIITSVGRLVIQKGYDIAVEICRELVNSGINVRWFIIGEGSQRKNIERKIKEYNLEKNLILVGNDINPYRWMNIADIYVQTSKSEGYGITIAEAKVLYKPIVASNIPQFREQLDDEKGILCNNTEEFKNAIIRISKDNEYKGKLIENLKQEKINYNELKKFESII